MSDLFKKIESKQQLNNFIDDYLENRAQFTKSMNDARIGEIQLTQDIEKFQKPITEKLEVNDDGKKTSVAEMSKQ